MAKTIIAICVLVFILLCCGCSAGKPLSDKTWTQVPEPPADTVGNPDNGDSATVDSSPVEPEEHPYEYILSPDFDRQYGIPVKNQYGGETLVFDFKEIKEKGYPFGEWTVDELVKKYGEASEIQGSVATKDYLEINVSWEDMSVLLQTPRNKEMSFDSDDKLGFQPLTDQDKTIKMPIGYIYIDDNKTRDIRGIVIGESTTEQVEAAYPPGAGDARDAEYGIYTIRYRYADFDEIALATDLSTKDTGGLGFWFDGKEGKLGKILVNWGTGR